jgi:hypothetical protein
MGLLYFYLIIHIVGVRGNEIADELTRGVCALKFVGTEPALGVSRQDTRRTIRRCLISVEYGGEILVYSKTGSRIHFGTLCWVPRLGFCPLQQVTIQGHY